MITVSEIITQAKERSDQENSSLCSPDEIIRYVNHAYSSLYDILVRSFDDIFAKTSDTLEKDTDGALILPDDFYKFICFLNTGKARKVSLKEYAERNVV